MSARQLMPRKIIGANGRNARWRHVKSHRDAFQLPARSRIKLHNERIMPWNDMALVRRKGEQPVKALQHFSDMEGRCKRPATCHVLVEMSDIGREHDKSAAGPDPDELKPRRMAAHRVHRQAWRKLRVAVVKHHAPGIIQPYNPAYVLDLERMRQALVAHIAPSIGQF